MYASTSWSGLFFNLIRKRFWVTRFHHPLHYITLPCSLWNTSYTVKAKSFPNTNGSFIIRKYEIENRCFVSKSWGSDKECFSHGNTSSVSSVQGRSKETTITNLDMLSVHTHTNRLINNVLHENNDLDNWALHNTCQGPYLRNRIPCQVQWDHPWREQRHHSCSESR